MHRTLTQATQKCSASFRNRLHYICQSKRLASSHPACSIHVPSFVDRHSQPSLVLCKHVQSQPTCNPQDTCNSCLFFCIRASIKSCTNSNSCNPSQALTSTHSWLLRAALLDLTRALPCKGRPALYSNLPSPLPLAALICAELHHMAAETQPHQPERGRPSLVVVAARQHLLAHGPQVDGVLKLRHIAALGLAQRGVGVYDAGVTQVLERHQVLLLACGLGSTQRGGRR